MLYQSTRGGAASSRFSDILLEGLAPDGGLMVPQDYPAVDPATLARWRDLSYAQLAFEILSLYCDDIDPEVLRGLVAQTYTAETFGSDEIVPLCPLDEDLMLLRLSNGPTLAFKDIAMQLLGRLFEYALSREGRRLNIVGATSGDTGSAAEYAMRGRRGIQVFMLSPAGRMSPFQQAQMFSLRDPNIHNIAIEGVFDDCQDLVKGLSADLEFKRRHSIGTVNSINWARVIAQVVYYFRGYFAATRDNDQRVSFCVPSGNFGNVLAGHIARRMGLPIERLVVATNENDVLDEFFRTGRYRVRTAAQTHSTSSPSMDISKASNFERFVFDLLGRDAARLADLWRQLDQEGRFDLSGTAQFASAAGQFGFVSGRSSHADRIATIRDLWQRKGVLIDTHTADGVFVARSFHQAGTPMICLETALPAKFAAAIQEAIGQEPAPPPAYADLAERGQRYVRMSPDLASLKSYVAARALA